MRTPPSITSVALIAFASTAVVTTTAHAADTWTAPFPGVRHLHRITATQNINALEIDLCAPGVAFRATKFDERGKRTSTFGASVNAQAAINGDFYIGGHALERGIAVGAGVPWPIGTPEDPSVGQLAFGDRRVELLRDAVVQKVEPWMKEVVGGRPSLLDNGNLVDTSGHPVLCRTNPRTAVGLTADKRKLYVAVVDGRAAPARTGMTCTELAQLMKGLGAHNALAFDGGGSSTMWLAPKGVVNRPSGGAERAVANHLAIFASGNGKPMACPASPPPPPPDGGGEDGAAGLFAAFAVSLLRRRRSPRAVTGS